MVETPQLAQRDLLRVRLVGRVEKWKDRKWWKDGKVGGWKSGRIKNILISLLFVRVKKWRDGKSEFVKIYSYILVKKWWPIKTSKWQTTKKKKKKPNSLKNKKHV